MVHRNEKQSEINHCSLTRYLICEKGLTEEPKKRVKRTVGNRFSQLQGSRYCLRLRRNAESSIGTPYHI